MRAHGSQLFQDLPVGDMSANGKTRDEALQNLREAIALYLEPAPGQVLADEQHEVVELA